MFFFTPRYLKQAKLLHKGVTRFLNYKRDVLPPKKLDEIESLRTQLTTAIKEKDGARIDALTVSINQTCERALPDAQSNWWAENIEVFFVSIVIAMGIRTYIAQPFKIPTGSMQPTLNGFIAEHTEEDPSPGFSGQILGWLTGTSYVNAVSDHDGELADKNPLTEHNFLLFFQYCNLHFKDGHTMRINAPLRQLMDPDGLGLPLYTNLSIVSTDEMTPDGKTMYRSSGGGPMIKKGQIVARGILHGGDQVIVNKFLYHFRRPTRGEVFVFTTKNIDYIYRKMAPFDQLGGSQHYIKRLAGVPGDTLDVQSPELLINGHPAVEAGFRRVIDERKTNDVANAYHGYSPHRGIHLPITLSKEPHAEYFAMGDNSYNSSDSRYWGPVPEKNVVGPGWFCYFPFTKHWGLIR